MLAFNKTKNGWLDATLEKGPFAGQTLFVRPLMCNSPTCPCHDITLPFFDLSLTPDVKDNTKPCAHVSVDVVTRKISKKHPSNEAGRNLIPDLNEEDWLLLQEVFFSYKQNITEKGDFRIDQFNFPMDDIERDGLHVAYRDILPYGEQFIVEIGNDKFLADDTYCVRTDCKCTECAISFLTVTRKIAKPKHPMFLVDYKTGATRVDQEDETNKVSARQLYGLLLAKYPDLLKQLQKRRTTIADLYRKYKAFRAPSTRTSATPEVGRNDPCPCGSGKKFKKCCLS